MLKRLLILLVLPISTQVFAQGIDRKQLLSDIERLSSDQFEGRKTGTTGNKLAAEYIISRFKDVGLQSYNTGYKHPFSFKNSKGEAFKGTNLISYISGKSADVIVLSAHYDHIGMKGTDIFNGADDNASGVSALLAIAKYFSKQKPENTLVFIAFDAEEMGLQGAKAYLSSPVPLKSRIRLNVNLDMVSRNDSGELYAAGTYHYPLLKEIIQDADHKTGIKILFGHDTPGSGQDDWTFQSDHGVFAKENIPFIYFGVEDHAGYHNQSDKFSNINPDFFYSASNAILRSVIQLDRNMDKIRSILPKSIPTK